MFDVDSFDKESSETGVWTSFGDGEFLIAHIGNMSFQRELNRLQQPYRKKIDKGSLDPKVSTDLLCKAMAKYVLLGWKNVGSKGEAIEYSSAVALKVLKNNDEIREFVQEYSLDLDNYKEESQTIAVKS